MASGGSSNRPSVSRSFDFGADDVLCSYDDIGSQDHSNGKRSDSAGKDFRESRAGRPLVDVYSQREEHDNRDLLIAVEKCMKKYADNLLRFLEGISGRLSQLELYCYNLERSVGDLRADLSRDQSELDLKLKSLEKHLQEVHRSVQILRDKQELAETQKELAKLQLASKEASDGAAAAAAVEPKKRTDAPEPSNPQLALALPQQQQQPQQPQGGGAGYYPQRSQMMTPMPAAAPPPLPPLPEQPQYAPQRPYEQPWSHQQAPRQHFTQQHDVYPGGVQLQAPQYTASQNPYPPQQVSKPGGYGSSYYMPSGYLPPTQGPAPPNLHSGPPPPMVRSHPYAELIDKASNMGYPKDHIIGAIRRMEESGQPVDFNSLLDLLNARPTPAPPQRGWPN